MPVTISMSGGGDPGKLIRLAKSKVLPTTEDALYAGQRQRTRILDRTAKGVDAKGASMAPYSRDGPYYYNPNGRLAGTAAGAKISEKSQKAATRRLFKKLGGGADGGPQISSTGRSIRFASYAAFKRYLGRSGVDLRGPKAPHMLQGVTVKADGSPGGVAAGVRVGIYGEAAERANAHNEGLGNVPRRRFFDVGPGDAGTMAKEIETIIRARARKG